jgi:AAA+ superfamily predicted ATPase
MSGADKTLDLPRASDLPKWMGALRDRYLTTETGQFVLHGNVYDCVLAGGRMWSMQQFLDAFFAPSDKMVVHYDPGRGVWFAKPEHAQRAAKVLIEGGYLTEARLAARVGIEKAKAGLLGEAVAREVSLERDPAVVLPLLEALLVRRDVPCAVIVHYAEMVAPDGPSGNLSFNDRTAAATLHRWSLWDEVVRSDNVVMLLTSSLPDLARRVTRNPRVGLLHVPLPGAVERARFLAHIRPTLDAAKGDQLTRITAGLQLRQIQDVLSLGEPVRAQAPLAPVDVQTTVSEIFASPAPVNVPVEAIAQRKKEILEQECAGLIEVIEPNHDFSVVGGNAPIKAALMRIADHIRAGRRSQVPMGVLLVGPMGTGKSFVAEAFARESGLAAIKLKNFRDKWVGSTEANLEKVLDVIEGLGEILVIIDEGDRSIGAGGDSDGGVNSRVMARLKEFMSDTSHRGRIVFVMMTNRPDKLDTDLKRPGRFDLKIPFFHPEDAMERAAILRAQVRRLKVDADLPDNALLPILQGLEGYAAADLEALVLLAWDDFCSDVVPKTLTEKPAQLTAEYLTQAVADYMPTRERDMVRYMELLAVSEASNRRLLPERFAVWGIDQIATELETARRRALSR